jgi:hypothetical protein
MEKFLYKKQEFRIAIIVTFLAAIINPFFGDIYELIKLRVNLSNKDRIVQNIPSLGNSSYSLALYGYNVNPELLNLVKSSLANEGYTLTNSQLLQGNRPGWLARSPTVLYYDAKTAATARFIAQILQQATGIPFSCQIGAGLGVPKNSMRTTLKIHLVF